MSSVTTSGPVSTVNSDYLSPDEVQDLPDPSRLFEDVTPFTVSLTFMKDGTKHSGVGFFVNFGSRYDHVGVYKVSTSLAVNQSNRAKFSASKDTSRLDVIIEEQEKNLEFLRQDAPRWDVILTAAHNLVNSDGSATTELTAYIQNIEDEVEPADPDQPISIHNCKPIASDKAAPGWRKVSVPRINTRICPQYSVHLSSNQIGPGPSRASDYGALLVPITPTKAAKSIVWRPRPGFGLSLPMCLSDEAYEEAEMPEYIPGTQPGQNERPVFLDAASRSLGYVEKIENKSVLKYVTLPIQGNVGEPVWVFDGDDRVIVGIHNYLDISETTGVHDYEDGVAVHYGYAAAITIEMMERVMAWAEMPWRDVSIQAWSPDQQHPQDMFLHFCKPALGAIGNGVIARDLSSRRTIVDVFPGRMPQGTETGTWATRFSSARTWGWDYKDNIDACELTGRITRADLQLGQATDAEFQTAMSEINKIKSERARLQWVAWDTIHACTELKPDLGVESLFNITWLSDSRYPTGCVTIGMTRRDISDADAWEERYRAGKGLLPTKIPAGCEIPVLLMMNDTGIPKRGENEEVDEDWEESYMGENMGWIKEDDAPVAGETRCFRFVGGSTWRPDDVPGEYPIIRTHDQDDDSISMETAPDETVSVALSDATSSDATMEEADSNSEVSMSFFQSPTAKVATAGPQMREPNPYPSSGSIDPSLPQRDDADSPLWTHIESSKNLPKSLPTQPSTPRTSNLVKSPIVPPIKPSPPSKPTKSKTVTRDDKPIPGSAQKRTSRGKDIPTTQAPGGSPKGNHGKEARGPGTPRKDAQVKLKASAAQPSSKTTVERAAKTNGVKKISEFFTPHRRSSVVPDGTDAMDKKGVKSKLDSSSSRNWNIPGRGKAGSAVKDKVASQSTAGATKRNPYIPQNSPSTPEYLNEPLRSWPGGFDMPSQGSLSQTSRVSGRSVSGSSSYTTSSASPYIGHVNGGIPSHVDGSHYSSVLGSVVHGSPDVESEGSFTPFQNSSVHVSSRGNASPRVFQEPIDPRIADYLSQSSQFSNDGYSRAGSNASSPKSDTETVRSAQKQPHSTGSVISKASTPSNKSSSSRGSKKSAPSDKNEPVVNVADQGSSYFGKVQRFIVSACSAGNK